MIRKKRAAKTILMVAIAYLVCMVGLIIILMMTGGAKGEAKAVGQASEYAERIEGVQEENRMSGKGSSGGEDENGVLAADSATEIGGVEGGAGGLEGFVGNLIRTSKIDESESISRADQRVSSRNGDHISRRDSRLRSLGDFVITAYTAGPVSTGKRPGDPGHGITASGKKVQEHRTIAADWAVLPPGTEVMIEGLPYIFVVEDRGSSVKGNMLDIYIADLDEALQWGRKSRQVWLVIANA